MPLHIVEVRTSSEKYNDSKQRFASSLLPTSSGTGDSKKLKPQW